MFMDYITQCLPIIAAVYAVHALAIGWQSRRWSTLARAKLRAADRKPVRK